MIKVYLAGKVTGNPNYKADFRAVREAIAKDYPDAVVLNPADLPEGMRPADYMGIGEALRVMEAWGFEYKTAAFVWVKKNRKNGGNFWGMGAYTRANAEVCLLGITKGMQARKWVKSHKVHQIVEAPVEEHSKKPDEVRRRIVELLGDVPRIELFARQKADGWDAWGDELPGETKDTGTAEAGPNIKNGG